MRVLLTHAYCWPYVRRGTERNMDVWYRYLLRSGYDVKILSTIPRTAEPLSDANYVLLPQCWSPWMRGLRLTPVHTFSWQAWRTLPAIEADVVHSYYFYDSLAACLRRGRSRRYGAILQLNGVPVPGVSCRRFFPPEATLMRRAVLAADVCIVCSRFVKDLLKEHMGGDSFVIPPPVDPELWPLGSGPRFDPPVVLAVGNFTERRKGIRVLVKAFELLRSEGIDIRLRVSGLIGDSLRAELASLARNFFQDIEFLGLGKPEDLPGLYQTASVLVLPAMWEPSGTVMMEAWLSGTPVVAPRHGGLPEFMAPGVGFLFDPESSGEETMNVRGLAEAMEKGLREARSPDVRERCRTHGERFSPAVVGPRLLELYHQVTGCKSPL
jgi:glycosyltransferase involved in cell wall biosynthesis